MTLLSYGGLFTSYVYLEPQIVEVASLSGAWVTPLFLLFGTGLFVGNLVGGKLADKSLMPAVLITVGSLVLMLFVMYFAIRNPMTSVVGFEAFTRPHPVGEEGQTAGVPGRSGYTSRYGSGQVNALKAVTHDTSNQTETP